MSKHIKPKPIAIKNYPLLEIDWVDSHMKGSWVGVDHAKNYASDPGKCKSVGYLVGETEEMITLVMNLSLNHKTHEVVDVADAMSIPKVAIRSRNEIVLD